MWVKKTPMPDIYTLYFNLLTLVATVHLDVMVCVRKSESDIIRGRVKMPKVWEMVGKRRKKSNDLRAYAKLIDRSQSEESRSIWKWQTVISSSYCGDYTSYNTISSLNHRYNQCTAFEYVSVKHIQPIHTKNLFNWVISKFFKCLFKQSMKQ